MAVQHSITLPLLPSFQSKPVQQLTVVPKPYYNLLVLLDGEWVWSILPPLLGTLLMLDMHKLEVSGLQCCVCVCVCVCVCLPLLRPTDNSYQTVGRKSARYGSVSVCVCVSVCLLIYRCCVSLPTKDVSRTTLLSQR